MKNFVKLCGFITFAVIIVFSFAACKKVSLEGTTWEQSDGKDDCIIAFSSPPNMTFTDGGNTSKGTYTISGNKVTITVDYEILTGTISGNILSFKEDGETYTFTKK
jgi:hypothetical protein